MKILYVLEHFYPYIGGAEKVFYELATHLSAQEFEIIIITTQYDNKLPSLEIHKGVKIVRVKCINRYGFTLLSLPKIIQHSKGCDFIHTTTYNAALPAIIAGRLVRKSVLITFHEVWGQLWKLLPFTNMFQRNVYYLFEKLLLKLPFKKFIAVSEFTKSKLIESGVPENKVERIYNGLDYAVFKDKKPMPPEVFTYTYFGRLGISKGLDLLIPAAAEFRKSFPNSKLKLIIPKQPKGIYNEIIKLISKYGLKQYVEIKHNLPQPQLVEELVHSSCIIIPSYSEGFCFAAAEAVALNLPIITSQRGALKEVVSGSFIEVVEQNPIALSQALKAAYFQHWTETPIKYFHLEDSIASYLEFYDRINKNVQGY
jgi:glycosyltransferase involved in cell wall biosynthesis